MKGSLKLWFVVPAFYPEMCEFAMILQDNYTVFVVKQIHF